MKIFDKILNLAKDFDKYSDKRHSQKVNKEVKKINKDMDKQKILFAQENEKAKQENIRLFQKLTGINARNFLKKTNDIQNKYAKECDTKLLTLVSTSTSLVGLTILRGVCQFTEKGMTLNITTSNVISMLIIGFIYAVIYSKSLQNINHVMIISENYKKERFKVKLSILIQVVTTVCVISSSMFTNFLTFKNFLFGNDTAGLLFSILMGCALDLLSVSCMMKKDMFENLDGIDDKKTKKVLRDSGINRNTVKKENEKNFKPKRETDFKFLKTQESFDDFILENFADGEEISAQKIGIKHNGTFALRRKNCKWLIKKGNRWVVDTNQDMTTDSANKVVLDKQLTATDSQPTTTDSVTDNNTLETDNKVTTFMKTDSKVTSN